MTTLEDDESLERELFLRRERALAGSVAPPVPRLEDVLRAAHVPVRSNVVPLLRAPRPAPRMVRGVLLVAACAAAMVAVAPHLRQLVAAAPEATIRPEPAPRSEAFAQSPSAPSAPLMSAMPTSAPGASTASTTSTTSTAISSSVYADVCGGDPGPGESSGSCESSCVSESP